MRAATERKIIRWFHSLASVPILGYIYGPVASIPKPAFAVKFVILPTVAVSAYGYGWGTGSASGGARHRGAHNQLWNGRSSVRFRKQQLFNQFIKLRTRIMISVIGSAYEHGF